MRGKIILHLPTAVEFVGCLEVAPLHLVEDGLDVNQPTFGEVEVDTGFQKFLCQQGNIEMVGVETGDVTPVENRQQLR